MMHYELSAQERTQIDGRWHNVGAPLCGTGDGHYRGISPTGWTGQGLLGKVDCPNCNKRKGLVAYRERSRILWEPSAKPTTYRINVVAHKNSYIGEVLHNGQVIAVTGFCHYALSARKRAGYIVAKLPADR